MFFKKVHPLIIIGAGLSGGFAWASGDMGCIPNWTLEQPGYDRCNNLPILTPSNDTGVNFSMLLADSNLGILQTTPIKERENGYGKVPFAIDQYSYNVIAKKKQDETVNPISDEVQGNPGFGSRCVSNVTGRAEFIDAVRKEENVPENERQLLIQAREKFDPTCADRENAEDASAASFTVNMLNISSRIGKEFLRYLLAASSFYQGRYDEAASGFSTLTDSEQVWLKEASSYMAGRTELNRAQQHAFDEYGFPSMEHVDVQGMLSAEEKFKTYLLEYPDGRYAASAKGLLRRIYWLSGRQKKLADEYIWQLNNQDSPQNNIRSLNDLVLEADNKLLTTTSPDRLTDPVMLAVIDLLLMRSTKPADAQSSSVELQKQEELFSNHKQLYQYLLAAHSFYVQNNPAAALKILPDDIPAKMTYLNFSRLALRGLALEATKDHPAARELWLKLLSGDQQPLQSEAAQLALAINYEQSGETEKVFAQYSPITDQAVRNRLIRSIASADLLRQIIAESASPQEGHLALHTLLYKDLFQGHYADFVQDVKLITADISVNDSSADSYAPPPGLDPGDNVRFALFSWSGKETDDGISCPSIFDVAGRLAKNSQDALGMICLGDLINSNDLDYQPEYLSGDNVQIPPSGNGIALGSTKSDFPGKSFSRGEAYKTIIADKKAASDLKVYALYRAIKCYATVGTNHCGGDDVDVSVRKSWFRTLKTRYKNSVWAKRLKYYW